MKKKTAILRGIAAIMVFLLLCTFGVSTLAFQYSGMVNNILNVSTSKIVTLDENGEINTNIFNNAYGTDAENKQSALEVEMAVALENITQAEEGNVLLKNDNHALPLSTEERITVFGNSSVNSQGTSDTTAFEAVPTVSFNEAMINAFGEENVNLVLAENIYNSMEANTSSEIYEATVEELTKYEETWKNNYNDAAIVVFSRVGAEDNDNAFVTAEGRHYFALSENEENMLKYLCEQKEAGIFKKIVAIINADQMMELGWMDQYDVDACLLAGLPGAVGFTGTANILCGKVNPSGHLVDTYVSNSLSAPAATNVGSNTQTWTNAEWVTENCADNDNNGLNINNYVVYAEGIYVGYKYYETRYEDTVLGSGNADSIVGSSTGNPWSYQDEVVRPFGYGLSYTTFDQQLVNVVFDEDTDSYIVTVKVTNSGEVSGKSVVEVYAQTPYGEYEQQNQVEKASVQFVGMEKTEELAPGESAELEISIDRYMFASYDEENAKGYILSAGDYYLTIGEDVHKALNNILTYKGYTTEDGMTEDGDAAAVYYWNQDMLDAETYRTSPYTGEEVTNEFDFADPSYYGVEVTYLSRSDWENTFPVSPMEIEATEEMVADLSSDWYETPADAPDITSFTQEAQNNLTFADMRLVDWDEEDTWEQFIDQMSVDDMLKLVSDGRGTEAIESIAMPTVKRADDGVHTGPLTSTGTNGLTWVTEVMTARTWSKERAEARGNIMATEATYCGLSEIWFGGGNIHRTAFSGRNREYYSEDGNFSYFMNEYVSKGMQDLGVIYCVKHFVLNDQETNRESLVTFTNEQALREIYLRSFEGALAKGSALGVMTSFNRLGCVYSAVSEALLTTVLRNEWGFKGHVTTDGYTSSSYKKHFLEQIVSGIDYVCMDSSDNAAAIREAVESGDGYILQALRKAAKNNLYAMSRTIAENGLSGNVKVVAVVPAWEIILLVMNAVFAAAFVVFTVLSVTSNIRNNKKSGRCEHDDQENKG